MSRSFVSSLLALSLLAGGCAQENGHYTTEQVTSAFEAEGITFGRFNPPASEDEVSAPRPVSALLERIRGIAGLASVDVPPRTVLRGWNTAVFVYVREGDARSKYDDLVDTLAAEKILAVATEFGVQRRGNVVATYVALSPNDPRLRQAGTPFDPSLYDGSFERRVTAALDRL
jgi:hypothetical protein